MLLCFGGESPPEKDLIMRLVLASKKNSALYAHWVSACRDREMPTRADINPEEIKRELPYVYIAEVMKDDLGVWFRFRLMGTKLVESLKQEGTGKMLLDLQIGGWEVEWRKNLVHVISMKMPVVDESTITVSNGLKLDIEHLAMPISEDGVTVSRIFGAIDFCNASEQQLSASFKELDWKTISSIELEKRIIISNLRIQL
jgi:hypothetical protein